MTGQISTSDYVIVGGGVSGLLLAYYLVRQPELATRTITIIEQTRRRQPANLSFWSRGVPLSGLPVAGQWQQCQVLRPGCQRLLQLRDYSYFTIDRATCLDFLRQQVKRVPTVRWVTNRVVAIRADRQIGEVTTAQGNQFRARYIFDSSDLVTGQSETTPYQGFTCEVECQQPVFSPETMTMFDFAATGTNNAFLYVLPYSRYQATVEIVGLRHQPSVHQAHRWINNLVHGTPFTVSGRIFTWQPTFRVAKRQAGSVIIPIGVKGGALKRSTGFAFMAMLRDAQQLTADCAADRPPTGAPPPPWLYRLLDRAFCWLLPTSPGLVLQFLALVFRFAPGDEILAYLDGTLPQRHIFQLPLPHWPLTTR